MVEKLIFFILAQATVGILALFKLWFSNERLKERVKDMEEVNKHLLDKMELIGQDVAVIKSHFELGTLTKLKTHSR